MKNKVSIITVTYNSSRLLNRYFKCLINNKQFIQEVIIVENNSIDHQTTKQICKSFSNKLKIKFFKSPNMGFGKSCNFGMKKSSSKYLMFLNPDVALKSKSLETLLNHMQDNRADISGGKIINQHKSINGSAVRFPNIFVGLFEFCNLGKLFHYLKWHKYFYYLDINLNRIKKDILVDSISGAYMLITRNSFIELGMFDEKIFMYLEDIDLCFRAKKSGKKIIYCPHSVVNHRAGSSSSRNTNNTNLQSWYDSRKYYFQKHSNFLTNLILRPIFNIDEFYFKKIHKNPPL